MSTEFFCVSAADVSSLRAGGSLYRACFPKSVKDLTEVFEKYGDDVVFVGGLTNTLVCDDGVEEIALFSDRLRGIEVSGESLSVAAGEKLSKVARIAAVHGLAGLEALSNIPGTVGGAVRGNAGAYGREISDVLTGVEVFRFDTGKTEYLAREEIAFSYRYSNLSDREYVLRAYFDLKRDDPGAISARCAEYKRKRLLCQPKEPSLGSVFKRYNGSSMGWFIERCGLKGVRKGAFSFSVRHAGFIVLDPSDTRGQSIPQAEDYLYLVRLAEKRVQEEFGFLPQREVKIIGDKRQKGD